MKRFGVSMDEDLLESFDELIQARGYENRSEAIRDLVRKELVKQECKDDEKETWGALLVVFDHHQRGLNAKLTEKQHSHIENVVSSLHVHLNAENCLEVIIMRGTVAQLNKIGDEIISTKGVKYGKINIATGGEFNAENKESNH